ncbi:MAG: peptidase [Synechococcus sp. SP2 MAG]|nr:peptidase [Synechococcus sp. SP2 MAG]
MQVDPCPPAQAQQIRPDALRRSALTNAPGYGSRLAISSSGFPVLQRWCVWVQPAESAEPNRWESRWFGAVDRALDEWSAVLPIIRVNDPERAHVRVERRRPPRRRLADGWRASNGRSLLQILEVQRQEVWRLEPQVTVIVSPELRSESQQATALHELGHAFGLWAHSLVPSDAMAPVQGASPVLKLSPRDQLTLEWMRLQPTRFGLPLPPRP